jgi:hypothetical protein
VRSPSADPVLTIYDPVQVVTHQETRNGINVIGENYVLRPWIGLSDSEEFQVSSDVIMTVGNLRREVREVYLTYVRTMHESKRLSEEEFSRSDAAEQLLRDVSFGEYKIIDDLTLDEDDDEE